MPATLTPGQTISGVLQPTLKGGPSKSTLSNASFDSTDATVFTVAPDPSTPNGFIITGVGSGTATTAQIQATATATALDGVTTAQVSGSDTITCSLVAPTEPVADGLTFVFNSVPVAPSIPVPATSAKTLFSTTK